MGQSAGFRFRSGLTLKVTGFLGSGWENCIQNPEFSSGLVLSFRVESIFDRSSINYVRKWFVGAFWVIMGREILKHLNVMVKIRYYKGKHMFIDLKRKSSLIKESREEKHAFWELNYEFYWYYKESTKFDEFNSF